MFEELAEKVKELRRACNDINRTIQELAILYGDVMRVLNGLWKKRDLFDVHEELRFDDGKFCIWHDSIYVSCRYEKLFKRITGLEPLLKREVEDAMGIIVLAENLPKIIRWLDELIQKYKRINEGLAKKLEELKGIFEPLILAHKIKGSVLEA